MCQRLDKYNCVVVCKRLSESIDSNITNKNASVGSN